MNSPTPKEITEAVQIVMRAANGSFSGNSPQRVAFIDTIMNDHPTLVGQFAKGVGEAVFQCATGYTVRDYLSGGAYPVEGEVRAGEFRAYRVCTERGSEDFRKHPVHDGRLPCRTVMGALDMAYQPLI